jgi:hypothetical protein
MADKLRYLLLSIDSPLCRQLGGLVIDDSVTFPYKGFEVTMNLTAWPGRGYLPDVGEAVATYWEKVGIKVKRRPVDRAIFSADFRARTYAGVTLAYAVPLVGSEPWEPLIRGGHSKASVHLFAEHPQLDAFIDRLSIEPDQAERAHHARRWDPGSMSTFRRGHWRCACHHWGGPGLGMAHPGHMGFHNWEYVTRGR